MNRCLMFVGLILLAAPAIAQDDQGREKQTRTIIEGTRSLEEQYDKVNCGRGDVLSCLRIAGFDCARSTDDSFVTICSLDGRPFYRLTLDWRTNRTHEIPRKWVVEIVYQATTSAAS